MSHPQPNGAGLAAAICGSALILVPSLAVFCILIACLEVFVVCIAASFFGEASVRGIDDRALSRFAFNGGLILEAFVQIGYWRTCLQRETPA